MRGKRGSYFFVLDVFIASAILILTLVIIFTSRVNTPPPKASFLTAEEFMSFLANTELRDTGGNYKNALVNQSADWHVRDSRMSLLQVVAYIDYYDRTPPGSGFDKSGYIASLAQGIIPDNYGINYSILDITNPINPETYTLFTRSLNSRSSSHLVLSAKRITYFREGRDLIGPYLTEVTVWS